MIIQSQKDDVVARVRSQVVERFPELPGRISCMYSTYFLLLEFEDLGIAALPCAGSMSWPRVTRELDDGVSPSHYSYTWSPDCIMSIISVAMAALPEMHVWVALEATREYVDINTRYFPEACETVTGLKWLSPPPPDYLWVIVPRDIPDWVLYEGNMQAIIVTLQYLDRLARKHNLLRKPKCLSLLNKLNGSKMTPG